MLSFRTSDQLPHGIAIALLAAALLLGGGGSPAPLVEAALQCLAALMAMLLVVTAPPLSRFGNMRDPAWIICALMLALPLLQLLPLPPAIWHRLPGHDAQRAALALISQGDSWRSWSVLPHLTLSSLLAMIPAAMLLVLTAALPQPWQQRMIAVIAAAGILTLLVGAAQMTGAAGNALRFYSIDHSNLLGFQANHNSTADILLIALLAMTAGAELWSLKRKLPAGQMFFLLAVLAVSLIVILGIVLTASRAGIGFIPIAVLAQIAMLRRHFNFDIRIAARGAIIIAMGAGLMWFFLHDNHVIAAVLKRFDFSGEFRPEIWKDAAFVMRQYSPFGSGMGTFVPVFMAAERLEVLDPLIANRAHNDFLELAIEGGAPAILLFLSISGIVFRAGRKALRNASASSYPVTIFACATLLILALHSLVDYPLRSMALACVAAVSAGLLLAQSRRYHAFSDATVKVGE